MCSLCSKVLERMSAHIIFARIVLENDKETSRYFNKIPYLLFSSYRWLLGAHVIWGFTVQGCISVMNCTTEAKFAEGQFFARLNGGYYICTSYSRRPFLVMHALFSCAVHMFTCCVHELFTVLIIISVMEKMRENTFPLRVLRNIVFKRHPHRIRASSPSLDSVLFTLLITSRISL